MYKFRVIKWTAVDRIRCGTQQRLRIPLALLYSNRLRREEVL